MDLKRKIIYAVSSLCRHFPYAQKKFLELAGLSVLSELFQEYDAEKLQLKAVTLLNDFLIEKVSVQEGTTCSLETFANNEDLGWNAAYWDISSGSALFAKTKLIFTGEIHFFVEISTCDPLKYKMDQSV